MSYHFAIVGGGWYGCHVAASLRALGFRVTLFEQHSRLLHAASGNNQFRLHLGFHYPRHYATRMQSREGFSRFVERYPGLSRPIAENLYAVPLGDSSIDFLTYRIIMTASGIDFTEMADIPSELVNVEGCLKVSERVLLTSQARRYFIDRLADSVNLGYRVQSIREDQGIVWVDGERFDFVIDATWGHYRRPPIDLFYEPTMLLYYEARCQFPAITMVDGPLCSIYPTEDPTIYTLSSVPHTPLARCETSEQARRVLAEVGPEAVSAKVALMEEQIIRYVPGFREAFTFMAPQFSIKTKPIGAFDDRSCQVYQDGRIFTVMSGKIDTIFFAVERILSMIEAMPDAVVEQHEGSLREDILDMSRGITAR